MKELVKYLNILPGSIISVVGAGGKTSFITQLCQELYREGFSVIFTTTTRILQPKCIKLVTVNDLPGLKAAVQRQSKPFSLTVGLEMDAEGKVTGVPPDWVNELIQWETQAIVFVEADGSRGLPFKAPAGHEPVIPTLSSMVVVVTGGDCIGAPLLDTNVHRPEIIGKITGKELGALITAEDVAGVLAHPEGGLKGIPPEGKVVFFLNKADNELAWEKAVAIAKLLREKTNRGRIIIGSMKQKTFSFYD